MMGLAAMLIAYCFVYYFDHRFEQKRLQRRVVPTLPSDSSEDEVLPDSDKNMNNERNNVGAKDLCLDILKSLNCHVSFEGDNPTGMTFSYQGENFVIHASNDCSIMRIGDLYWHSVDLDELEDVSRVRKAINTVNIHAMPTLMYTFEEEDNRMWVHTKMDILLEAGIFNKQEYLMSMFSKFFDVQRSLFAEIDRLKKEGDK